MKKTNTICRMLFGLALLACAGACFAQQPPANVTGSWTMYVVGTRTGETFVEHMEIAQDGNMLSGYYEGQFESGPIRGTINNHHIHFIAEARNPLNFFGDVFGNRISGTHLFHGVRQTWQAVRDPGLSEPWG